MGDKREGKGGRTWNLIRLCLENHLCCTRDKAGERKKKKQSEDYCLQTVTGGDLRDYRISERHWEEWSFFNHFKLDLWIKQIGNKYCTIWGYGNLQHEMNTTLIPSIRVLFLCLCSSIWNAEHRIWETTTRCRAAIGQSHYWTQKLCLRLDLVRGGGHLDNCSSPKFWVHPSENYFQAKLFTTWGKVGDNFPFWINFSP